MAGNLSLTGNSGNLTAAQINLCQIAEQFSVQPGPEIELKLRESDWRDMYAIIRNPNVAKNIRIICCSALKWLIYHKKFVGNSAIELFNHLGELYIHAPKEGNSKMYDILEIVLEAIPSTYMN